MSTASDEELGPIDYVVLEFPGSRFNGEITPALVDLIDRGLVRVLDLMFLHKDDEGTITAVELEDAAPEEAGALVRIDMDIAGLVPDVDIEIAGAALEPGSSACLLVWENVWAAPFASAVRRAGGQLVASGRIPLVDVLAALDAPGDE